MSVLQEYENIRKEIGGEKYKAIEKYLSLNPELLLSDIYYKEKEWDKFEQWYNGKIVIKPIKEITGVLVSCSVGHCAVIKTTDKEIMTSEVKKITMIWQEKIYFETENSQYVINGSLITNLKNI